MSPNLINVQTVVLQHYSFNGIDVTVSLTKERVLRNHHLQFDNVYEQFLYISLGISTKFLSYKN